MKIKQKPEEKSERKHVSVISKSQKQVFISPKSNKNRKYLRNFVPNNKST